MWPFNVTVRTLDQRITFSAIGPSSADVHAATLERFGGLCSVAVIRVRAKGVDPFAGLRGRAYIAARKLDQNQVKKLDVDATAKSESRENLINAINQRAPRRLCVLLPELTLPEDL